MIYVAHRGLLNGPSKWENAPWVIEEAISVCGNAEVDVWMHDNELWLGHDKPTYRQPLKWFQENVTGLWIHCKNIQAIEFFNEFHSQWHFCGSIPASKSCEVPLPSCQNCMMMISLIAGVSVRTMY